MSRRDRIITLLEHYLDVEIGLQDRAFRSDDFLPRMSRAWSHPSYVELRRLIAILQVTNLSLFRALQHTYFKYEERRVSYCPRCGGTDAPGKIASLHRHGQRTVQLVPRTIRVRKLVDKHELARAIDWLEASFQGEPFVPDDLLALVV